MAPLLSIQIVLIALFSVAAQWVAWRLHIPAIVFLLGFGFLLGPASGLIQPDILMGDLLKPAIAAAVAIILFEGSLQLNLKKLKETRKAVRRVIVLGAPLGWIFISVAAHYIAGLEWAVAVTLGGILVVTGPTVIMPMLQQAKLNQRVGNILKWEGIVNDPIGVIFAVLAYEYFVAVNAGHAGLGFFINHGLFLVFIGIGSAGLAYLVKAIFERGHMPEYLKPFLLLSVVLALFFGCHLILHESGLIAVTVLGVTLANIHTASLEEIKRFKETITIMLVSGVFILLTANLDTAELMRLDWQSVLFIIALLFLIRPVVFFICSVGTEMTWREKVLTGLIAPRGIVCAAMAGVLGPLLVASGFEDGHQILPIAFGVVVISVVLHSLMIKPLATKLDLKSEQSNGVIIVGAYQWSIQLAEVLKRRNVPILMVDNNWASLKKARLLDIPVYYGELLAEETEFNLEFQIYDTLIAATYSNAYNALLCETFGHEVGAERVFRIGQDETDVPNRKRIAHTVLGMPFVDHNTTLQSIWTKFEEGWRFRASRVGREDQGSDLIVPEESETRLIIGIVSKNGIVQFYSDNAGSRPSPKENDVVLIFEKEGSEPKKDFKLQ